MDIQFEKKGNRWIAEFQVTADFNLHLEREETGALIVKQRTTADGQYDNIKGGVLGYSDLVVDIDFTAVVYPKYIQVQSMSEPKMCVVTY